MLAALLVLALAMAWVPAGAARADERPPTSHLVWAGLGMAVPTYVLGVAVHEGSHALAARAVGAEVTEVHLLPGVYHGHFFFGYVQTLGLASRADRVFFLIAPKLVDMAMLGGYAAMELTDSAPGNHYLHLATTVLATGFWVDFSKDIPAFWGHSDVVKLYNLWGAKSEWQRLPLRLVHAGLSAAAAYAIARGYQHVFEKDGKDGGATAVVVPLWVGQL